MSNYPFGTPTKRDERDSIGYIAPIVAPPPEKPRPIKKPETTETKR